MTGYSGKKVGHGTLCTLPVNDLAKNIFIVLWYWYLVIMTVTILWIIYRILWILVDDVKKLSLQVRLQNRKEFGAKFS